jgi:hypothetical protein
MNFLIVIPERVCEQLDSAFVYYEEKQAGLGIKFLDDWENTMDHLEKRPFIYQLKYKQFRTIQFNRFPFLVVFKIVENSIILNNIIHSKRSVARRYKA